MDRVIAQLAALSTLPDRQIDLVGAALEVSRLFRPEVDSPGARAQLAELGARARGRLPENQPLSAKVDVLNALLFGELGFAGNREDFEDPGNSFLDLVLERRLGIPISLSLIYVEVACAAGVPAWGVGFPGHFLVKVGQGADALLIDPFNAGISLSQAELDERLARLFGDQRLSVRANPGLLRAATRREILVRMLRNLKGVYLARGDADQALRAVSAILALAPDLPEELRERGLLYRALGHHQAALDDLRRFSALCDDGAQIASVATVIDELAAHPRRIH